MSVRFALLNCRFLSLILDLLHPENLPQTLVLDSHETYTGGGHSDNFLNPINSSVSYWRYQLFRLSACSFCRSPYVGQIYPVSMTHAIHLDRSTGPFHRESRAQQYVLPYQHWVAVCHVFLSPFQRPKLILIRRTLVSAILSGWALFVAIGVESTHSRWFVSFWLK
jgi:hypothetical protein